MIIQINYYDKIILLFTQLNSRVLPGYISNPGGKMNILHGTRRRMVATVLAVTMLVAGGSIWYIAQRSDGEPALYTDSAERRNYETALKESPHRTTADFAVYIEKDGRVHATDPTRIGFCEYRCATVVSVKGGYHVTLPVGFSYRPGSQSFGEPFDRFRVLQLTFWDSVSHQPRTVVAAADATVTLPKMLYQRSVEDMNEGETAYTTPDFVRMTPGGPVVLSEVFVKREPGGDHYGLVDMARLTRTEDGFDVCLPTSYGKLIENENADGIPARVLDTRC